MVASYCLMQFGVTWAYITAYVVAAEILPTPVRATGLGVSVAVGRVGAEMGRRAANRPQKQPSIKALDSAVLSDAQRKTF